MAGALATDVKTTTETKSSPRQNAADGSWEPLPARTRRTAVSVQSVCYLNVIQAPSREFLSTLDYLGFAWTRAGRLSTFTTGLMISPREFVLIGSGVVQNFTWTENNLCNKEAELCMVLRDCDRRCIHRLPRDK